MLEVALAAGIAAWSFLSREVQRRLVSCPTIGVQPDAVSWMAYCLDLVDVGCCLQADMYLPVDRKLDIAPLERAEPQVVAWKKIETFVGSMSLVPVAVAVAAVAMYVWVEDVKSQGDAAVAEKEAFGVESLSGIADFPGAGNVGCIVAAGIRFLVDIAEEVQVDADWLQILDEMLGIAREGSVLVLAANRKCTVAAVRRAAPDCSDLLYFERDSRAPYLYLLEKAWAFGTARGIVDTAALGCIVGLS